MVSVTLKVAALLMLPLRGIVAAPNRSSRKFVILNLHGASEVMKMIGYTGRLAMNLEPVLSPLLIIWPENMPYIARKCDGC